MKLWAKFSKMGLDEFELKARVPRQNDLPRNEILPDDLFPSVMNPYKGTIRSPQISFPSWIIKSYNPSDKFQTANCSVLQSLNETYQFKEKHTEESVISYLDGILQEYSDGEEKEIGKNNSLEKLQCEMISKKGQQFEIHLDKSSVSTNKSENINGYDSEKNITPKRSTPVKKSPEKEQKDATINVERNEITPKQSNETCLVTVKTSPKVDTTVKEGKTIPDAGNINMSDTKRKYMERDTLSIELIKPDPKPSSNKQNTNAKGLRRKIDNITIELTKSTDRESEHLRRPIKKGYSEDIKKNILPEENKIELSNKVGKLNRSNVSNPGKLSPSSTSIDEIEKTFEDLNLLKEKDNRFSSVLDLKKPAVVLKTRPRSAEYIIELHKVSNQSGNKTELRRTCTEPLKKITEEIERVSSFNEDTKKSDEINTSFVQKTKSNSFLKSDIFSSFNRFFKYSKPRDEKNTSAQDFLPSKRSPPIVMNRTVRGFDSFMMY